MFKEGQKIIYVKGSSHGEGAIPLGAEGIILKFVENPETCKVLVDFGKYKKAVLPLSCVQEVK